MVFAGGEV